VRCPLPRGRPTRPCLVVPAPVDAHGGYQRLAGRFPDVLLLVLVRTESVQDWDAVTQIRASVPESGNGGGRGDGRGETREWRLWRWPVGGSR